MIFDIKIEISQVKRSFIAKIKMFVTTLLVLFAINSHNSQKCYKQSTSQCTGIPVATPSSQPKPFFGTSIQDLVASEGVTVPRNLDKIMLVLEQNGANICSFLFVCLFVCVFVCLFVCLFVCISRL